MGLKDFLTKDVETSDLPKNPILRTHYYRCEYKKAKEVLLQYFNKNGSKVSNIDDNYHEIFIENSSYHIIITINKAAVLNVGIDLKVSVYSMIGANKPHKIVKEIYAHCDKNLPYVGLQPGM